MAVSGSLTPAQVSFLLAIIPIFVAWVYSEWLEYKKSPSASKVKAEARYAEALKVKPDFYEGHLALGQQQFEQAKLSWYYALGTKNNLEEGPYAQVLDLYNKAEDNMENGMQMWEEFEERRLNGLSISDEHKAELVNVGLEGTINDIPADEAAEQAVNIRSQIYILWGTLLYERSVVEFKLSLPSWEECFEVSIEKFELAGASPTDITVIIKNYCCNGTALEGLSYKINEIVQAWNEMFEERRLNGLSISDEHKAELVNVGLEGTINDIPADEAAEQTVNIRSQIYILWGTVLYERSVVEFKLSLPSWEECLEVSIEKYELAGPSQRI